MTKHFWKSPAFEKMQKESEKEDKPPRKKPSTTYHSITVNGSELKFKATAGYMDIIDEEGNEKAHVYYTGYEKEGVKDITKRPITICFNGGPGASSMWLHFGALGPMRMKMNEIGDVLEPPYEMIENEYTWLQFSDLVFIDPVGTGYSRARKDEDPKQFWGLEEDVKWVGEFIRLYLTRNKRWASPKYLAGESYGTTRAAALSGFLQDEQGMDLNGIILISSVLDFQTANFSTGNDLPYMLYLPTYTAIAHFHKKLPERLQKDLDKTIEEVEEWIINDYVKILAKGTALTEEEVNEAARRLSEYSGLSEEYIKSSNLRIKDDKFTMELLRRDRRVVGRMDGRITGHESDYSGSRPSYDPSFSKGPFVVAVNDYIRRKLEYENNLLYNPISMEANINWKWGSQQRYELGHVNVADTLTLEMNRNRYLKVFVAAGYYDLATPHFAAKYTINHMFIDKSRRENLTMKYYGGGHMVYYDSKAIKKFYDDILEFYKTP